MLAATATELLLENVAVDPDAQRAGIGRSLIGFAEAEAVRRGLSELLLYANAKAIENLAFYRDLGFTIGDAPDRRRLRPRLHAQIAIGAALTRGRARANTASTASACASHPERRHAQRPKSRDRRNLPSVAVPRLRAFGATLGMTGGEPYARTRSRCSADGCDLFPRALADLSRKREEVDRREVVRGASTSGAIAHKRNLRRTGRDFGRRLTQLHDRVLEVHERVGRHSREIDKERALVGRHAASDGASAAPTPSGVGRMNLPVRFSSAA